MASKKLLEYYFFRRVIKLLMLSCGTYPVRNPSRVYRLIPYIHMFLMTTKIIGSLGFAQKHITNIPAVSKRLSVTISQITILFEFIMMMVYRENLGQLRETVDKYFETLVANKDLTKKVTKGGAVIWRLSLVTLITFFIASMFNVCTPIMAIIKQHKLQIHPIKYFLPNGSIYPWKVTPGGLLWKFHYLCEAFSCYTLYAVSNSVVSLFCLNIFQIIGHLRAMSERMLHLDQSGDPDSIVRDCIHRYEKLLECRNGIEKIFGPVVYWLTLTNAVAMCLAIFQLSQLRHIGIGQAIFFTIYMVIKLIQTFLCGYTGSQLTAEADDYKNAVYSANWIGDGRLMSSIVIMLSRTPMTLVALNFRTISIDMFATVVNTTISYFFFIQAIR